MDFVKRRIKENDQYQSAEMYSQKMQTIYRITHWNQSKLKFDEVTKKQQEIANRNKELAHCLEELKKQRNYRLKQLYDAEALFFEAELAKKGLAIYKTKA